LVHFPSLKIKVKCCTLEVMCIVIIKGYYWKKVINSALKTKSDIHFKTTFLAKTTLILKRREYYFSKNVIICFYLSNPNTCMPVDFSLVPWIVNMMEWYWSGIEEDIPNNELWSRFRVYKVGVLSVLGLMSTEQLRFNTSDHCIYRSLDMALPDH